MSLRFATRDQGTLTEVPPVTQIWLLSKAAILHRALVVVNELGIADLIADGPRTADELARATSSHAPSLFRVLRLMSSLGIFSEVEPGRFGLTPLSECLRSDTPSSLRAYVRMTGLPVWLPALAEATSSVETGQPMFSRTAGAEFFDYLSAHPEEGDIFNAAMSSFGEGISAAVVAAYDFSGIRSIVDVGGGTGNLITRILEANPNLTGILFDLPHVVAGAQKPVAKAGFNGRCKIVSGDFFRSVPGGADAYVLRWIIHDWDRDRALTILRNCRVAMGAAARLLLVEMVLPPGEEFHCGKVQDFVMMTMLGGQERTEAGYGDLLQEAGFRLRRCIPTASPCSVIEAVAA